tara:strand:+ start:266 stop:820 length:555 start_codon:yes stop_codon:yes gene_type:complete
MLTAEEFEAVLTSMMDAISDDPEPDWKDSLADAITVLVCRYTEDSMDILTDVMDILKAKAEAKAKRFAREGMDMCITMYRDDTTQILVHGFYLEAEDKFEVSEVFDGVTEKPVQLTPEELNQVRTIGVDKILRLRGRDDLVEQRLRRRSVIAVEVEEYDPWQEIYETTSEKIVRAQRENSSSSE